MFGVRRAAPPDVPALKSFLTPLFTEGEFGDGLVFGELEMEDYLDWALPRALVDPAKLVYVLEFTAKSSVRTYGPRIVGWFCILLDEPGHVPQGLAFYKTRLLNSIQDIQIWPNKQAAEVHRRFTTLLARQQDARRGMQASPSGAQLACFAVHPKFRGVGLCSRMLAWAAEVAQQAGLASLYYLAEDGKPFVAQGVYHTPQSYLHIMTVGNPARVSDTRDLASLAKILTTRLDSYLGEENREESKREVVRACEKIVSLVQTPFERIFVETAGYVVSAVASIAVALRLPHHVSADASRPSSLRDLAAATGAQEELIWRVLRILTQKYIFEEVAPGQYIQNAASETLQLPGVEAWVAVSTDDILQASAALLPLLKENNFQIPVESGSCAFSKAFKTNLNQFEYYFEVDAERGRRAAMSMSAFNTTSMFADFPYPFDRLSPGAVVVDMGGGSGHVSANIAKQHPHLRFIVQDSGEALAAGKENKELRHLPLEWQELGLFDAQTVQGAEVYMIRHCMHGFTDSVACKILRGVAPAMEAGRSRILIIDCVVPDLIGGDSMPFVNATDIMALLGGNGKQRNARQWQQLVQMADPRLQVVNIWKQESLASADAVIEIELH
ncbi:hypothetical protein ASPZODRAFT_17393 [Penicilliopsis zonata CBS 506.65]|uniref:Uncharacterized protein n=1 Tax=Penicilliopsis zonata CBS 506.65 TaxID=1073090 RepID=A0A1L9SFR6_9EURO|nr:hypothetical protein ASPZODRAFT_17393 [Penicilliopsis zonata CBS 506.65]OJJ45963.1 hypothetical protein ASPZODRAFT_17393 [Penicilliopsis zonata CBS 506.65]